MRRWRLVWIAAVHLAVVPAIGWSNYLTGPDVDLALFYLVPIAATAWWFGGVIALVTAVEASVVSFGAEALWRENAFLALAGWNTLTRAVIFVLTALFVSRIRAEQVASRDELQLTREELARSHEQLRLLFDGIREYAVMMLDTEGRILICNDGSRRLRGYEADELIGKPFGHLSATAQPGDPQRWLAQAVAGGSYEYEAWELRKDGSRFGAAVVLSPLHDGKGRLQGFAMVTRDVTREREAEAAVRSLTARLITAQEEERRHVARELHDEIGAVLTCVKMSVEAIARRGHAAASELQTALESVGQALEQVRQLSGDLRPSVLDDLGVVPAVRWYLDKRARAAGIETHFSASIPETRLPAAVEITCFRIVQEAVTNVLRHASGRSLWVELSQAGGDLVLRIRDDGVGFQRRRDDGLGLSAMRERAALIGGRLEIRSSPGQGTEVEARLPLPSQEAVA